jgi:hypothetical protein
MGAIKARNFLNSQASSSPEGCCTMLLLLQSVPQLYVITSESREWKILVCFSFVTKLWVGKVKMIWIPQTLFCNKKWYLNVKCNCTTLDFHCCNESSKYVPLALAQFVRYSFRIIDKEILHTLLNTVIYC